MHGCQAKVALQGRGVDFNILDMCNEDYDDAYVDLDSEMKPGAYAAGQRTRAFENLDAIIAEHCAVMTCDTDHCSAGRGGLIMADSAVSDVPVLIPTSSSTPAVAKHRCSSFFTVYDARAIRAVSAKHCTLCITTGLIAQQPASKAAHEHQDTSDLKSQPCAADIDDDIPCDDCGDLLTPDTAICTHAGGWLCDICSVDHASVISDVQSDEQLKTFSSDFEGWENMSCDTCEAPHTVSDPLIRTDIGLLLCRFCSSQEWCCEECDLPGSQTTLLRLVGGSFLCPDCAGD
ncbi:unnamed protein product [Polarella glacialis]|uniref:Uncharacterized protein n=1 Tax=Polarella glacialis TaxID=89957 RepID=A0A813H4H9_POLGL|nr:unnamed protein product [Polarella glacialis]